VSRNYGGGHLAGGARRRAQGTEDTPQYLDRGAVIGTENGEAYGEPGA
jgi:hypothetical protein